MHACEVSGVTAENSWHWKWKTMAGRETEGKGKRDGGGTKEMLRTEKKKTFKKKQTNVAAMNIRILALISASQPLNQLIKP